METDILRRLHYAAAIACGVFAALVMHIVLTRAAKTPQAMAAAECNRRSVSVSMPNIQESAQRRTPPRQDSRSGVRRETYRLSLNCRPVPA